MAVYTNGSYHVHLKILNGPISPSFNFDNFVGRSPMSNLDILPTDYLVFPHQLGMVGMVHRVIELGNLSESN